MKRGSAELQSRDFELRAIRAQLDVQAQEGERQARAHERQAQELAEERRALKSQLEVKGRELLDERQAREHERQALRVQLDTQVGW